MLTHNHPHTYIHQKQGMCETVLGILDALLRLAATSYVVGLLEGKDMGAIMAAAWEMDTGSEEKANSVEQVEAWLDVFLTTPSREAGPPLQLALRLLFNCRVRPTWFYLIPPSLPPSLPRSLLETGIFQSSVRPQFICFSRFRPLPLSHSFSLVPTVGSTPHPFSFLFVIRLSPPFPPLPLSLPPSLPPPSHQS